jgi:two-component system cell cycle sensor histidine kinase/response regulator CckA
MSGSPAVSQPTDTKLEAVGRLAGGVAHDFNNLLTVIFAGLDEGQDLLPPGHPGWQILEDIRIAARRAAGLTRQLLTFVRHQVVQPKPLDLNAVLRDLDRVLQRVTGEDITLHTHPAEALPLVLADDGQLGQVVLNLVLNARDAMPAGGTLTIVTRAVELAGTDASAHPGVAPGSYVLLTVTDTGAGIRPEVAAHLFEPFFTTKSAGRGTGLGLATSLVIVSEAGGYVQFDTELDRGTTFKVYLPQLKRDLARVERPTAEPEARAAETILVVEDEPMVRTLTARFLRGLGYTVLEAKNGQAALGIVENLAVSIDLIVTSMVTPEMGGLEMVGRLHGTRPNVRVLFLSVYSSEITGGLDLNLNFLQKPFTRAELGTAIRRTLTRPGA